MTTTAVQATTDLYWASALAAALLDAVLVLLLARWITAVRFRHLTRFLVLAALLFWGGLWGAVMTSPTVWAMSYRFVFPEWARWAWPLLMALLYGGIAWGCWWLAVRIPGRGVVPFLLLGGLVSFPGHLWAIYARGLLETPLLQGVSAASALVFGFFEFIFYWCVVLILAILFQRGREWWAGRTKTMRISTNHR